MYICQTDYEHPQIFCIMSSQFSFRVMNESLIIYCFILRLNIHHDFQKVSCVIRNAITLH